MKHKKIIDVDFNSAVWEGLNAEDFKKKATDLNVFGHIEEEAQRAEAIQTAFLRFSPQAKELTSKDDKKALLREKEAKS
ncbi:MAG: hypothetical protein V4615_06965 [Bacteroidota bacterium]